MRRACRPCASQVRAAVMGLTPQTLAKVRARLLLFGTHRQRTSGIPHAGHRIRKTVMVAFELLHNARHPFCLVMEAPLPGLVNVATIGVNLGLMGW